MRFSLWIEEKEADKNMAKAKHADLITLPDGIPGTNCGNCRSFENGFCEHPEVKMKVTERQCCKYWDNDKVKRPWGEMSA